MTVRAISGRRGPNLPPRGRQRLRVPPGARIWAVDVEMPAVELDVPAEAMVPKEWCRIVVLLAEKQYPGYLWRVRRPL
jgi:hypothetical protein